jgi:hypothetical protein
MTGRPIPHNAPPARRDELHSLSVQLYGLLSAGHDALAYNVDPRGPALMAIGADGKRRPVQTGAGSASPPWQRARELQPGGGEVDRRFNPWVLAKHLRGKYAVAPAAPGWVQWVALDIDAHPAPGSPELVARRLARARADRVLAQVWRALQCSADRHPLVLRSPGGGYHVWFPLTRGPTSANPEHTWPALVARAWFERHLLAAGLELAPGVLEVFPAGRCLRAPCGLGMQVLQATRPEQPDALGLVAWPGTMASEQRVDWRGTQPALSVPVRRVVPMVKAFLAQWEAQRRTIADWLGRPEATWDPAWGFLGWRTEEISLEQKTPVPAGGLQLSRSQESDDVPGRLRASVQEVWNQRWSRGPRSSGLRRSGVADAEEISPPSSPGIDDPPEPAADRMVRGRAFKEKVRRLLSDGITEPSTRHDAVLTLAFYWVATCGLGDGSALARLAAWCAAHAHEGSRLGARPRMFRDTCLREARHYIAHHAARWRFRGHGDGGGLATLTVADHAVIAAVDARVRGEVSSILAWLAGRADSEGRLGAPVQIASGLLGRLCGDRRIAEQGQRRRSTTLALAELERIGVLTLAHNYRVGQRGRVWSCWYQFGSGVVPRVEQIAGEDWAAICSAPAPASARGAADHVAPPRPADPVEVRVVAERAIPEGKVRILSDGERGLARTLVQLAADVVRPAAAPNARLPWFVRPFVAQTFTPGALQSLHAASVIPFPDVAARRRMTRGERLAWGGGLSGPGPAGAVPRDPLGRLESAPPSSGAAPVVAPGAPPGQAAHVELVTEVGPRAAALPLDLADVIATAWRTFRRGRDP